MSRTWRDRVVKTASKVLAAALTVTTCMAGMTLPAHGAEYGKNGTVRDMTSQEIVEDMGFGYNIGNTFDSIGSWITIDDPWEYQRGWQNDPVTKNFIKKVKEAGFRTIRFPVSWAQWIDDNNQIDPAYMNAIQTVVDWCMEEDFYVILNIHHDSGAADTSWVRKAATDWDWTSKRYEAVWTQIANNFKDYGDHLIFEGMNEVEFPDASNMSKQYELLNAMNQMFVDTVRKTGGNNAKRHLLIPGYNTDIKKTCDRRYQFPKDPADHCILSIHYYSPSPFCVAEYNVDWAVPATTWGTEEEIKQVESDLDMLAENFISKGTPVIIGEYGVLTEDKKEVESIRRYIKTIPEMIMEYGMCPILWDSGNSGDMKYIERVSGNFRDPVIGSNYQALARKREAGQIKKREFHYPNYKKVAVPVSEDGWVSLASFQPSEILGISFDIGCSTGWDSYGGGGLYLDGWDSTINFEFKSVFDEVKHIFTEEEKARLQDRLGVMFWWTDESQGGNRKDQLWVKRFHLLYDETSSNGMADQTAYAVGGGDLGGVGTSRRPNKTTAPAGKLDKDVVTYVGQKAGEPDEDGWIEIPDTDPKPIGICYCMSGGNKYGANIQTDEGYGGWAGGSNNVQNIYMFGTGYSFSRFKLEGKTVKNMTFLYSDGEEPVPSEPKPKPEELKGYVERLEANVEGKYIVDPERKPIGIRFMASGGTEYGTGLEINQAPWYCWINSKIGEETTYRFADEEKLKLPYTFTEMKLVDQTVEYLEVVYELPKEETKNLFEVNLEVNVGNSTTYSLEDLRKKAGINKGERIKITVSAAAPDGSAFSGSVSAKDKNGNTIIGLLGNKTSIVGEFSGDTIEFKAEAVSGGSVNPYIVESIKIEEAPGNAFIEFGGAGSERIEINADSDKIKKEFDWAKTDSVLKIYYEYGRNIDSFNGALVVNNDGWDHRIWSAENDGKGNYMQCKCDSLNSIILCSWGSENLKITDVVYERNEITVQCDSPQEYDIEAFIKESGLENKNVKVTITAESKNNNFDATVSAITKGGTKTGKLSNDNKTCEIEGIFKNPLKFEAEYLDGIPWPCEYKVTKITVKSED